MNLMLQNLLQKLAGMFLEEMTGRVVMELAGSHPRPLVSGVFGDVPAIG